MAFSKKIKVVGSPLVDIVGHSDWRPGGSANMVLNLMAYCRNLLDFKRLDLEYIPFDGKDSVIRIKDYVDGTNTLVIAQHELYTLFPNRFPNPDQQLSLFDLTDTLVFSDYKGFDPSTVWPGRAQLLVVDSKYHTPLPKSWLDIPTRIWRCAHTEYSSDYAEQFTHVIITIPDGTFTIKKEDGTYTSTAKLQRHKTRHEIMAIGSGDLFTAILAAELTFEPNFSPEFISTLITETILPIIRDNCKEPYVTITDYQI